MTREQEILLKMAKKALSADTSSDLISRADAMGAVQDHFNANGFNGYDDGQKMMDRINALPSADAVSREALNGVKFVAIKGDKVEEAYRSGWNGAIECIIENAPSADAEPKRVLQGYNKGANIIQTIRHEELTQIANTRKAVESAEADMSEYADKLWKIAYERGKREASADAVQGEWIKKQVFNPELDTYVPFIECSVCGYEPYYGGSESKFNYCANCGARMEK